MKHKVGDTVKIKSIDWFNAQEKDSDGDIYIYSVNNIVYFTKDMSNYCSKEAKIEDIRIDDNIYFLDVDKRCYEWTDEMLDENYDFKQLAVGETFDFKGHKLRVEKVQKTSSCENCFFEKLRLSNVYACDEVFKGIIIPSCCYQRNDNNSVIFKEVTDMEERTIKLDIETARKWYNGSDDSLRTLALQAFSENELKDSGLPNTWNEFCLETPIKQFEYYISADSGISQRADDVIRRIECDKNVLPNKKSAESILALCQLTQLRDRYRQGWVPDWKDGKYKYIIDYGGDNLSLDLYQHRNTFLSFQSKEIRDLFVKNFKDLIELAKEYI